MKVVFLGTGTSQGVPVIGCKCHVCKSLDTKDKRLRSSILIHLNDKNYVIDTGPDFRQQMLREEVDSLDAVLFTHSHKDHIAGLDDIRAFNFIEKRATKIYCSDEVETALRREFYYIFQENKYPGVPEIELNRIDLNSFKLPCGEEVVPIEVLHYRMPVLGFRIRDFAYVTDAKSILPEEKDKLYNLDVLVLNALRIKEHISHLNLTEALELIQELNPKMTYLTHISHLFETHELIEKMLPSNVKPAYDGLVLNL